MVQHDADERSPTLGEHPDRLQADQTNYEYSYSKHGYTGRIMDRPADLYDREQEWTDLSEVVESNAPGLRIAIVSGRRRQGKSYLLRRLAAHVGGMYHQAQEVGRQQALARFGDDVARRLGLPVGALGFEDWEIALRTALRLPARGAQPAADPDGAPRGLVLDELPYLLTHSPEIPSVLQDLYDESRQQPDYPSAAVILCGSALSVMSELLVGQNPLRGRAKLNLTVAPFDYRDAAAYWEAGDPLVAFHLAAIFGGTPGYKALVEQEPPASVNELGAWLARNALNPSHALFSETDYLLREDPRVRAKETYQSILTAVAAGNHSQTAIGGVVGRDYNHLRHPLDVLVTSGFLVKRVDVLTPSRPALYYLADPIVRFEALVTSPCRVLLEERDAPEAWRQSQETFSSRILGPHFEDIARRWTAKYAGERFGALVGEVGSAVINDAEGKSQHELDVVGLRRGRRAGKAPRVVVLGEAKSSNKERTLGDLARLERIRVVLAKQDTGNASAHLVLFGRSGFDRNLTSEATGRPDVHLLDLAGLYA